MTNPHSSPESGLPSEDAPTRRIFMRPVWHLSGAKHRCYIVGRAGNESSAVMSLNHSMTSG